MSKNDRPSDDAEGTKRLQSLCRMTEPKFYRPTSAEGDKSSDRKAKEGCEIVFTIPKDRDVACRFSPAGAYDGAAGLGTFTEVDDAMKDHLKDPLRCTEKRALMKREWTYRDSSGTEYGPYTWQELVTYAREGRIDPVDDVRRDTGPWQSPADAGVFDQLPGGHSPKHPHRTSEEAISTARAAHASPHNRLLYLLLGILLPLTTGLAGVNNLVVGRTGPGLIQLMLCLFNYLLIALGFVVGITFCLAIPLGTGIMIWSVIEAATNTKDGKGQDMAFK